MTRPLYTNRASFVFDVYFKTLALPPVSSLLFSFSKVSIAPALELLCCYTA
jgi:hypothetical protein